MLQKWRAHRHEECQVTETENEPDSFILLTIDFFRHPLIYSLDFCKKNVLYKRAKKIGSGLYPLTSQEILKYFSDGFLKNPMCQVTLLNLSTGICSNPRLIALYYRNRVGVGEGLGRVILNTKEGARERPKGCWALVPGRRPSPYSSSKALRHVCRHTAE